MHNAPPLALILARTLSVGGFPVFNMTSQDVFKKTTESETFLTVQVTNASGENYVNSNKISDVWHELLWITILAKLVMIGIIAKLVRAKPCIIMIMCIHACNFYNAVLEKQMLILVHAIFKLPN